MLLVHGWESARDRTLPNALLLNAIGIHVLTIDIRGHGLNPPEELPLTAGEFGADALAGVEALLAREDVTAVGILGHSMGGIGALLAAAAEPRVKAVVAASTPADPYRLTRQTFRLAKLPLPGPLAYPLAFLTTHVFLEPRGHTVRSVSAARAIETYRGPVLLIHGDADRVVPVGPHGPARAGGREVARRRRVGGLRRDLMIPGGQHSWLYEFASYRGAVGRFFATAFGGPLPAGRGGGRRACNAGGAAPTARASVLRDQGRARWRADVRAGRPHGRQPRMTQQAGGMDVWSAIRTKRMVRRFRDEPLAPEQLERIVDAGRHAASSKNQQRWDFIAVQDRERLRALSAVGPYAGHVAGAASAVALLTPDPREPGASLSLVWDLGLAAENMMLAAWELGIGSCPATVYDQAIAREVLGHPDDRWCGYVLSFGFPADPGDLTRPPKAGGRRPLDDILHRERW